MLNERINKPNFAGYIRRKGFNTPSDLKAARARAVARFKSLPKARRALIMARIFGKPAYDMARREHAQQVTNFLDHTVHMLLETRSIATEQATSFPRPLVNNRTGMPLLRGAIF
jgi:hypothetical protein